MAPKTQFMEKNLRIGITFKLLLLLLVIFEIPAVSSGQNLKISDFVLFGKNVQFGTSSSIYGGSIGEKTKVSSSGILTATGIIYSGGTVVL